MGTTPKNKAVDAEYLLNQLKNLDKDILETKYVQEKDVKDTYTATDENPISGKGVAVAVNTLQQDINKKSNIGHKHTKSEITDFPTSMTPTAHNQASNTINAMTDYSKATSVSAITPTDTLNVAIGKLEKALDSKGTSSFSGSYNDLVDKPTIPSLDGYAKTSEIPSKVSQLENDSNYLSSIPEEYVTDAELESKGYLTEHQDISGKVDKVEGKSLISDAEIARLASVDNYDDTDIRTELANKADITAIPTVDVTKSYVDTELAKKANTDHTHTTVNGHTVEANVPSNAVFTDTVYNDSALVGRVKAIEDTLKLKANGQNITFSVTPAGLLNVKKEA